MPATSIFEPDVVPSHLDPTHRDRIVQRILDGMFALVWLLFVFSDVPRAIRPQSYGILPWFVVVVLPAAAAAAWWWLRRTPRWGLSTAAFAAAMVALFIASDSGSLIVYLFITCVVLMVEAGWRWTLLVVAILHLAAAAMISQGPHPGSAWPQIIFLALISAIAMSVGLLIGQYERERRRNRSLLAQLHAANVELAQANEQILASVELEKDLVLAQERARSARDVHDGLGHRLTTIGMSLDFALRMRDRDPTAALDEVAVARGGVTSALAEMRQWVRALHPARPSGADDPDTWQAIAASFQGTGLALTVQQLPDPLPVLPGEVSAFVFRFVQEGLTNVVRHAHADRATLTLCVQDMTLVATLADNGGHPQAEPPTSVREIDDVPTAGFGLRSLQERAHQLNGCITAGQVQGCGFVVEAELPLHVQEEASTQRAHPTEWAGVPA